MLGSLPISPCRFEAWRPRHSKQRREIEILLEVIGEIIKGRLELLFISKLAGICSERVQKSAAERIAGEEPVQVASGDAAIATGAAIDAAVKTQHWALHPRPRRVAEMHLVTFDRRARRKLDTGGFDEPLVAAENRVDLEQPEPVDALLSPFDAERVRDAPPNIW